MQEVSVKPRSFFKHSIVVEGGGKELTWSFSTKHKNISFGLFKKVDSDGLDLPSHANGVIPASSAFSPPAVRTLKALQQMGQSTPANMGHTPLELPEGRKSETSVPDKSSMSKMGSISSNMHAEASSPALPTPTGLTPRSASKRTKTAFGDELIEILPVSHYESSKFTVKGVHYCVDPGTFVLVFDNTFSVNTSKKLIFSVSVKELEVVHSLQKMEYEGWIYKKGNRKRQGFSKRWLKIDTQGNLQYFKSRNSESRGSIALASAAVHANHDNLLIDIDSGRNVFHFRAGSLQDFNAVLAVIEAHNTTLEFTAPRISAATHSSYDSSLAPSGSEISLSYYDATEDVRRQAFRDQQKLLDSMSSLISSQAGKLKELIETAKTKVDIKTGKDISPLLLQMTELVNTLQSTAMTFQTDVMMHGKFVQSTLDLLERTEMALQNCVVDDNKLRKIQGVEHITVGHFMGKTRRSSSPSFLHGLSTRGSEIFYDAESNEEGCVSDDVASESEENDKILSDSLMTPDSATQDAGRLIPPVAQSIQTENEPTPISSEKQEKPMVMTRRKALPASTVSMESVNIMSIFRNNIGKDLSTISMPIALNEPINLLQKLCEELEYSDLLDKAASTADVVDRLVLISGGWVLLCVDYEAFAISGYASTVYRPGRKPFNPLLGETYECIRPDKGFKFIAEKVSHQPPIMACFAEGKGYQFYQENHVKPKFWGKSMELLPSGMIHVVLTDYNEHYTWSKVTTCTRNVFSSGRYLEHYGTMKITNHKTGHFSEIQFKESGYFTSAKNEIQGFLFSPKGDKLSCLRGKWDETIHKYHESAPDNLQVIWRAIPAPPHHADMYGFTQFAVELNELTPDLVPLLPNTDTRFRPDQRMYEEGKTDEAELEKQRLEQKQREYRKALEARGEKWLPQYFELRPSQFETKENSISKNGMAWQYKGTYFEARGNFIKKIDLFGNKP